MMYQVEFLRSLIFALGAAMMMSQAAFSQVIGEAGGAAKVQESAVQKNTATAPTGRSMRPRRTTLVVTTANGRRVVVSLKKPRQGLWPNAGKKAAKIK